MLYAVLSGSVQETLSRQMDRLTPADFGITNPADEPEMTRDEMNERITANCTEIDRLKLQKMQKENELIKLS
jgi:hypothetical protein